MGTWGSRLFITVFQGLILLLRWLGTHHCYEGPSLVPPDSLCLLVWDMTTRGISPHLSHPPAAFGSSHNERMGMMGPRASITWAISTVSYFIAGLPWVLCYSNAKLTYTSYLTCPLHPSKGPWNPLSLSPCQVKRKDFSMKSKKEK